MFISVLKFRYSAKKGLSAASMPMAAAPLTWILPKDDMSSTTCMASCTPLSLIRKSTEPSRLSGPIATLAPPAMRSDCGVNSTMMGLLSASNTLPSASRPRASWMVLVVLICSKKRPAMLKAPPPSRMMESRPAPPISRLPYKPGPPESTIRPKVPVAFRRARGLSSRSAVTPISKRKAVLPALSLGKAAMTAKSPRRVSRPMRSMLPLPVSAT